MNRINVFVKIVATIAMFFIVIVNVDRFMVEEKRAFPPTMASLEKPDVLDQMVVGSLVVLKIPNAAEYRTDISVWEVVGGKKERRSFIAAPAFTKGNLTGFDEAEITKLYQSGVEIAVVRKADVYEAIAKIAFPPKQ
jgi:hypothetical protein